jgi:hypothetical protein
MAFHLARLDLPEIKAMAQPMALLILFVCTLPLPRHAQTIITLQAVNFVIDRRYATRALSRC